MTHPPGIEAPSVFWRDLAAENERMLANAGLDNFKRTVANNYFNWLVTDPRRPHFTYALRQWARRPDLVPIMSTIGDLDHLPRTQSSWRRRHVYRLYVSMLWSIMSRYDALGLRDLITEPNVGNPVRIEHAGRLISQDLAHSILECNALIRELGAKNAYRVLELGAGYGRLAHVMVATDRVRQYVIVDIEPAISVSQWYLTKVLGEGKVRRVQTLDAAAPEDRVVLLNADAITTLPDRYFDSVVSISTLPELTPAQVSFYMQQFQRLSSHLIFLKQWDNWTNPNDGTHLVRGDYRLGDDWSLVLDETDPLIVNFFSRAWRRAQ